LGLFNPAFSKSQPGEDRSDLAMEQIDSEQNINQSALNMSSIFSNNLEMQPQKIANSKFTLRRKKKSKKFYFYLEFFILKIKLIFSL
jgi:hypothetical protein